MALWHAHLPARPSFDLKVGRLSQMPTSAGLGASSGSGEPASFFNFPAGASTIWGFRPLGAYLPTKQTVRRLAAHNSHWQPATMCSAPHRPNCPPTPCAGQKVTADFSRSPVVPQKSIDRPRHYLQHAEYNFCNSGIWATLPASRLLAAAIFNVGIARLISAPQTERHKQRSK